MSDRTFERAVRDWLDDGSDRTPRHAIDAVLLAVKTTPQERDLRIPRRFQLVPTYMRLAAVVAVVAVVGVGAFSFIGPGGPGGPGGSPTPIPSPTQAPTTAPTVTSTPLVTFDPATWTPYTSEVYGFTTALPPGWAVEQSAIRPWDPATDPIGWDSPAVDTFTSPAGDLAVSAWGVAVEPSPDTTVAMSWEAFEAWIETLCTQTDYEPCTGIHDRVEPMCPDEDTECHTGAMIVPFTDSVAGFKGGDRGGVTIVVDGEEVTYWVIVSVWQDASHPSLAPYGGGMRLIQSLLASMGAEMPSRGPVDHSNH